MFNHFCSDPSQQQASNPTFSIMYARTPVSWLRILLTDALKISFNTCQEADPCWECCSSQGKVVYSFRFGGKESVVSCILIGDGLSIILCVLMPPNHHFLSIIQLAVTHYSQYFCFKMKLVITWINSTCHFLDLLNPGHFSSTTHYLPKFPITWGQFLLSKIIVLLKLWNNKLYNYKYLSLYP